jgi:hypothetical protein
MGDPAGAGKGTEGANPPETSHGRWRQPTVIAGMIGVLATVIVGFVTYWLRALSLPRIPGTS